VKLSSVHGDDTYCSAKLSARMSSHCEPPKSSVGTVLKPGTLHICIGTDTAVVEPKTEQADQSLHCMTSTTTVLQGLTTSLAIACEPAGLMGFSI